MFPFAFVNIVQHRYIVPIILLSELAGCTVAFIETHFWALDTHQILVNIWFAYLAISVTVFSVAVAVLGPLRRHRDKVIRTVAGRLFALAFCYIACNGCFGALNIARFYLCVDTGSRFVHPTMTRMVCQNDNFITVVFIFPTINSMANAIVIARSQRVRRELRTWVNR
eukprot:sb/3472356/